MPGSPKPGDVVVLERTDTYKVIRVYSSAGFTDTTEWEPGCEPVAEPTVSDLAAQVQAATTLIQAKDIAAAALACLP